MDVAAQLRQGITTRSAEETREWGRRLAEVLPPDCVLALHGDLGVGKTTFVQGLARGFHVTDQVTSPTFAIYSVHRGARRSLVHLDAYRLERPDQLEALLLDEFLTSPYCLAVEWPEKVGAWLPADAWHVTLSIVEGDRHGIKLV
ncbi:MAG TPA: tRNA (adenosine(37)-N6)-threonylcarbamoyltransferase complex ATPase subunit type 1 TsaE [Opitutaceae bacterium]|nr:tRNA (adenosine(37)-N6)-threonylcarbamoyltransferase complex ATPase subunit type 1 TsaE [Opitutaceae bacterium]